jgi:hypothetical protein
MLISRISRRISGDTGGRPPRRRDFQRQYNLKPARCQRITVSGRTIASVSYISGNSRQTPPSISLSIDPNRSLLGLARHSTLICCLSTTISASSVARDRSRSITVPKISLHKSNIEQQPRPIRDQPPTDWIYDRDRRNAAFTGLFDRERRTDMDMVIRRIQRKGLPLITAQIVAGCRSAFGSAFCNQSTIPTYGVRTFASPSLTCRTPKQG